MDTKSKVETAEALVLPEGWTKADIQCLLDALEQGKPILVGETELGIPNIHEQRPVRHCGMGVMKSETPDYTIIFDAGMAMRRTPRGHGYTGVSVRRGEYPYDYDGVRETLMGFLTAEAEAAEAADADAEIEAKTEADQKDETDEPGTGFVAGKGRAHNYVPAWMTLPKLYAVEKSADPLAVIKLFTPDSNWTWYVLEYDPDEDRAFGLVAGFETELGYFSIAELREVKGPMGLSIERDVWFEPTPVTDLPEYQERWSKFGGPYKGTRKVSAADEQGQDRPEPKFAIGDQVVFSWLDDPTPYTVCLREWREFEQTWAYKAHGKWWNESGLVPFLNHVGAEQGQDQPEPKFAEGDHVWWEDQNGEVLTGTVDFIANGSATIQCDQCLAVGGGVPIGRLEHVPVGQLHASVDDETEAAKADETTEADALELLFKPVVLPDPILDLDAGVTIRQMMALINEPYVYSEKTEGVAANAGKFYIRFTVDAARVGSAVRFEGQLYDSACSKGPQQYNDYHLDDLVEWDVKTFARLPVQTVKNLLAEARAAREQYPDVSAKADQMYRQVMKAYDLGIYYEQESLLKIWLSLYELLQTSGKNFQPRIIGQHIEAALRAAFGDEISRWEDIRLSDAEVANADEADDPDEATEATKATEADDPDETTEAAISKGDLIEVDLGYTHGWATAEVRRLRGKWLYYALTEQKPDKRRGKVQVIGRDILWRPVASGVGAGSTHCSIN